MTNRTLQSIFFINIVAKEIASATREKLNIDVSAYLRGLGLGYAK